MSKNCAKVYIILSFCILFILNSISGQDNLQWPCGQYVTRQERVSGTTGPFKSVIELLFENPNGTVGLEKVCENTSNLFNAAVFYDGYIWAWKQYAGTAQGTGTSTTLLRINNDCTVTEYPINFPTGSSTAQFNAAYVDANGIFYVARPSFAFATGIQLFSLDLKTVLPMASPSTNTVALRSFTVASGTTNFTGTSNFGDIYFDGTTAYIWQNNQGMASLNLTNNTYTRIGTSTKVVGSLFINADDPGFIYGYGAALASSDNNTQNSIVKINTLTGEYIDVAVGSVGVSQSDGAGCPLATFEEPAPLANPDESLNNPSGSNVTVSPIIGNDVIVGLGFIDGATVNMVPPAGALNLVTDANGDVTSMDIPGEGTWTVNPTTGDITFDPLPTFTGNPTVISYNVADDKGNRTNNTTVTVTYLPALPVDLISFKGNTNADNVVLFWKTANEKGFSHFDVQVSSEPVEFASKGTVSSNGSNIYNFIDISPILGINYYRLKMVDLDGNFKYSNTIAVGFKQDSQFLTITNPVNNGVVEVNTNFKNPTFTLLNAIGQNFTVKQMRANSNSYTIDVKNLNNGIYYLQIVYEGKLTTKKILINN